MQIFRVKKPSCKILKTKNCVPFEVQFTSSIFRGIASVFKDFSSYRHPFLCPWRGRKGLACSAIKKCAAQVKTQVVYGATTLRCARKRK